MTRRTATFQLTEADARKLQELEQLGFGTKTDVFRQALDRMHQQEARMYNEKNAATVDSISRTVIENGRVEGEGEAWLESLRREVEFEATERGHSSDDAAEIAAAAVERYR